MIKVHYCPTCGCFYTCCSGGCSAAWQVAQCGECERRGPARNGSAYLAAVDGRWADKGGVQ